MWQLRIEISPLNERMWQARAVFGNLLIAQVDGEKTAAAALETILRLCAGQVAAIAENIREKR